MTISKNVGWHLESSTLSLVNGWRNEKKIGPKKHFREALEENVSYICTHKKNQIWYHQTSKSVCRWLVVLEIIKKDAFLSILSLKKTMAWEKSRKGYRVLGAKYLGFFSSCSVWMIKLKSKHTSFKKYSNWVKITEQN